MAQILRTVALLDRVIPAAGETARIDLPVNPLSCLLVSIKALNLGIQTAANQPMTDLFNKFSNFNIRYRGATIVDGDPLDLAATYATLSQWVPQTSQINNVDNDVTGITFPILLGRVPYDPKECFPATRRGDLVLEWTAGIDGATKDNFLLHVETVELLDANPERFLKVTSTNRIMTAGDTNDIDLPIGNKLLGLMLRGATFPTGASRNASFSEVRLEVDNSEVIFSRAHWETLQGELGRRLPPTWMWMDHVHQVNAAGAGVEVSSGAQNDQATQQRYGYMDLDPLNDLSFALDTRQAADVTLGVVSDVTDGAASRVLPVEYVEIAGRAAA